jgi:hypothetical protein
MPFEAVWERQAALMSGACRLSLREVDCSAQAIVATETAALQRFALLFAPELKVESATLGDDGRSVTVVVDGRLQVSAPVGDGARRARAAAAADVQRRGRVQ